MCWEIKRHSAKCFFFSFRLYFLKCNNWYNLFPCVEISSATKYNFLFPRGVLILFSSCIDDSHFRQVKTEKKHNEIGLIINPHYEHRRGMSNSFSFSLFKEIKADTHAEKDLSLPCVDTVSSSRIVKRSGGNNKRKNLVSSARKLIVECVVPINKSRGYISFVPSSQQLSRCKLKTYCDPRRPREWGKILLSFYFPKGEISVISRPALVEPIFIILKKSYTLHDFLIEANNNKKNTLQSSRGGILLCRNVLPTFFRRTKRKKKNTWRLLL